MEASAAESALGNLGFATCIEAAVLDQRGWVIHLDHQSLPLMVDVRQAPGLRSVVQVKFTSLGLLSVPSDTAILEHRGVPMLMFDRRTPAQARWETVLELRTPLR